MSLGKRMLIIGILFVGGAIGALAAMLQQAG